MVRVKVLEVNSTNSVIVEGEHTTTIKDLRNEIERRWEEDFESISKFRTKLIYQGHVLVDSQTLEEVNVNESDEENELSTFLLMIPPPEARIAKDEVSQSVENRNDVESTPNTDDGGSDFTHHRTRRCCSIQ